MQMALVRCDLHMPRHTFIRGRPGIQAAQENRAATVRERLNTFRATTAPLRSRLGKFHKYPHFHESNSLTPSFIRMRKPTGLLILLALIIGCSPGPSDDLAPSDVGSPTRKTRTASPPLHRVSRRSPTKPPADAEIAPPVGCPFAAGRETWEVCHMQGQKIGYMRTRIDRVEVGGRTLIRTRWTYRSKLLRFGEPVEMTNELISRETIDGRLVDYIEIQRLGPTPMQTEGRVEQDRLVMTKIDEGNRRAVSIPWSTLDGGHQAVEFSLAAKPMQPGETRNVRKMLSTLNRVATVRLVARDIEPTPLLHGERRLLRIDTTWFGVGPIMEATIWVDSNGDVLKTRMEKDALQQEVFRCTRAEALDESGFGKIDLGRNTIVPIDRKISEPHGARRIRYRVSLTDGDPAAVLVAGPSQRVRSVGPGVAEVTVLVIRPDWPEKIDLPAANRPTMDDVKPNGLIQSDDERIRAMAAEATQGKTDAWSKAVALERYVHDAIRNTNFSQALASAADVARTREGDCTEFAVLLAALARAANLPARVAIGLVYFEPDQGPRQAFGYHMWTEIYVGDRWIPMDATLGRGGAGPAHLKLAHANLKDADPLSSILPVVNVLGKIKIEVLEVEP